MIGRATAREDGDYVGFWARFAASLIDLVGVMFVVVPATARRQKPA